MISKYDKAKKGTRRSALPTRDARRKESAVQYVSFQSLNFYDKFFLYEHTQKFLDQWI